MRAEHDVHRLARLEPAPDLVPLARSSASLRSPDAHALLPTPPRAAQLTVLVERLAVAREALLQVPLARPRHRSWVALSTDDRNQYRRYFSRCHTGLARVSPCGFNEKGCAV
jgi:hypothetical protein